MSRARQGRNVGASVRARLLDLSRRRGVEFQLLLSDSAIERLLFRLGASQYGERYVLKGAMLFKAWMGGSHRATWDLDLLGCGASAVPDVVAVIRELCVMGVDDGIVFDTTSISGEEIRAEEQYAGVRVRLEARLAEACIPVQVDVGFGDTVVPAPVRLSYPTLLDHAPPLILVYPRQTVVAEKLEAIVSLGVTNSRIVHVLASYFAFEGPSLARAIRATFERRRTPLPESEPVALTPGFLAAPERQTQWRAFLRKGRLEAPIDAAQLAEALRRFLGPALQAAARDEEFALNWPPGGPWQQKAI